jgi:hypothetical protein
MKPFGRAAESETANEATARKASNHFMPEAWEPDFAEAGANCPSGATILLQSFNPRLTFCPVRRASFGA